MSCYDLKVSILVVQSTKGNWWCPPKDTMVIFGADYEDDGINLPNDTVGLHQYSDGKVWPQYLADMMNMKLQNYAVAGGTTGIDNVNFKGWSGNQWQVDQYLKENRGRIGKNVLIGVATGAVNEMFSSPFTEEVLSGMVNNIASIVDKLMKAGSTTVFVLNTPDYTLSPAFQPDSELENVTEEAISAIKSAVLNYNEKLYLALQKVSGRNPNAVTIQIDFYQYWNTGVNSKQYKATWAFDFGDGTAVPSEMFAWNPKPDDAGKYAFYDAYHPAAGVHYEIAKNIMARLVKYYIKPYDGKDRTIVCKSSQLMSTCC